MTIRITAPRPRASVASSALTRPDWTKGDHRDPNLLWLDKNENTDPELIALTTRLVSEIDPKAIYLYPELHVLYQRLAKYLGVRISQLLLAPGSDGIIRAVFEAYVDPGETVVHTSPTFAMYGVYSQIYAARVVTVPYRASAEGPVLDAREFVQTIRSAAPKVVFLPNPDSPTGAVLQGDALRSIIEAAGEAGAIVLVDEAYHPFYDGTVLPWLDEYPHLVVARTCAKAWGLAGLRIGYGVAGDEVALLLHKVRNNYEVNMFAAAMMEKMLDHDDAMRASVRRMNEGRDLFLAAMRDLGLRTLPAHANFLHVAFGEHAPRVHAALADLVLYRRDFSDPALQGFSRFSATTRERFAPVIERIREAVTSR